MRKSEAAARWARAAALCALLAPASALAENRPTMLADYAGPRSGAVEVELGWYTDSDGGRTLHALTPAFGLRLAVARSLDLELDWPLAFASLSRERGGDIDAFRSGNPFLALYHVDRTRTGYLRVGFGVSPPLAQIDDAEDALPFVYALAMRGSWDGWLYAPEHLGLVVPLQIESRHRGLLLGLDSAAAVLVATGDNADETDLNLQLAGLLGGTLDALSGGVRLQAVWTPTADGDNAQLALVPFVQGDFDGGFVYLRVLLNLDEPFGFFDDGAEVWGLLVGAGGRF